MNLQLGNDGNPVIDQLSEEGFVDLTLQIHQLVDDGSHYRFHLAASHNDSEVGLDVILVKGIKSGFDANMDLIKDHVYRQGVRVIRSGIESDRLISAMGILYGADPVSQKMVPEESFTAIALHQGDLDLGCRGNPVCIDPPTKSIGFCKNKASGAKWTKSVYVFGLLSGEFLTLALMGFATSQSSLPERPLFIGQTGFQVF